METMKSTEPGKEVMPVQLHWMIRAHLREVLAIEAESFEFPWNGDDFFCILSQRSTIGMAAEHDGRVAGFMIYELNKARIHVLNFAVAPQFRRRGVGSQMVAALVRKLSSGRRNRITLEIRETNLAAQLFFRSHGFRAVAVLRGHYDDTAEDAYRFVWRLPAGDERVRG